MKTLDSPAEHAVSAGTNAWSAPAQGAYADA
jgi:hypothetical protein